MHDVFVKVLEIYNEHRRAVFLAGTALLLLVGSIAVKSCYDRDVVDDYIKEEQLIQEKASRKADAVVAEQRTKDALENKKWEDAYEDAIEEAQPSAISDSSRRLGCERLRRAKIDVTQLPACSGD